MRQLAQLAGVHTSTVSRVLNGDISRVSDPTAARIRALAKSRSFQAHPGAASLRTGRTRVIGVLVPRITDVVLAATFEAIETAATAHDYQALVSSTWDRSRERKRRVELYVSRRVDGLIIADARLRTPYLDQLHRQGVPFVLVSRRCGSWPSVTGDDVTGGGLAAKHLLEMGHRDIGVLAGPRYASTAVDRVAGFRRACAEEGVLVPDNRIIETTFDVEGGRTGMRTILEAGIPTAVFAVNDYAAIGAIGVLSERGLTGPTGVAVVGYNDISIASQLSPALTTVRSQAEESGRLAVQTLLTLLENGTATSHRLTPELIVRASTYDRALQHPG